MNIKREIRNLLEKVARREGFEIPDFSIEEPVDKKFGDFSTNLALKLAAKKFEEGKNANLLSEKSKSQHVYNKQSATEIANKLVVKLIEELRRENPDCFEKIETISGFINFHLSKNFLEKEINNVIQKGKNYAASDLGHKKLIRVEFVSANPTGPLHVGNARGGPIGDVLSNIFKYLGYRVLREYFVNDVGGQVYKFGLSLVWFIFGDKFISEKLLGGDEKVIEYKGDYMLSLAKKVEQKMVNEYEFSELRKLTLDEIVRIAAKIGVEIQLAEILKDLRDLGICYDKLYFESDVARKKTAKVISTLRQKGFVSEKDGAVWFGASGQFLDKDSVLVKSNGELTYFANDIAYHCEKFESNPEMVIVVLGAGHHGHLLRMKAAISALGFEPDKYKVIIYQHVFIKQSGQRIKMAKRKGEIVPASHIIRLIGKDAFRFFMLSKDYGTHLDFDLELATKRSEENPVFYIQYAYARISNILKQAKKIKNYEESHFTNTSEVTLAKRIIKLPVVVEEIAENFAVHRLAYYGLELADLFHKFYEECRVINNGKLIKSRLHLVEATGIVLGTVLDILGISAPTKM